MPGSFIYRYALITALFFAAVTNAGAFSPPQFNNGTSSADINDLMLFVSQWLSDANSQPSADWDANGVVNFTDFAIMAAYWNSPPSFVISGTTGIDHVRMNGLPGNPFTDQDGSYRVMVSGGWSGTVTPAKPGFTFDPPQIFYSDLAADANDQNFKASQINLTISGNAGADGAIMNGLPGNPVTTGGGIYSAEVPFGWNGTVRPTLPGYQFNPASVSYTNVTADLIDRNFTATQILAVTVFGSTGIGGVQMIGLPGDPCSDQNGYYSVEVPLGWSGIVTPQKQGYTFGPSGKIYSVVLVDMDNQNYMPYQITSCVITGNVGTSDVIITGLPNPAISTADGSYMAIVPYNWSGSLVPTKRGYKFSPQSISYNSITSNLSGRNFTAVQITSCVISGYIGVDGAAITGLDSNSVVSDGGYYTITVPYDWSGTITPVLAGYTFAPASRAYTAVENDFMNEDYSALQPIVSSENCIQWRLNDNSSSNTVVGSEINGQIFDGADNRTSTVASNVNGVPAFHLNGNGQYVRITVPRIWPSAQADLWTKYSGNPVLKDPDGVLYGQLAHKPGGGWYFFGAKGGVTDNIDRWESTDLIHWYGRVEVLHNGGPGSWDSTCQVATVFQKPDDNTWVMFYRGWSGDTSTLSAYAIGKATSTDGTHFVKKDNGGFDDGLLDQFGGNFDPIGIILVDGIYYMYVNGAGGHGNQNLYTSIDLEIWTAYPGNPIFEIAAPLEYCAHVWHYDGWYYMLIPRDLNKSGTSVGDHAIGLYRSTSPIFNAMNREFLGYPIINDQWYDYSYLDTPSIPTTDIYRTTYAPEFGDTLYCLYSSAAPLTQSLAYTTLTHLKEIKPKVHQLFGEKQSYSFWVQFDRVNPGDVLFSIGSSSADSTPVWLCSVRSSGSDKVLALYLANGYRLSSTPLSVNTPYHVVIVQELDQIKMYINGQDGFSYSQQNVDTDDTYIYLGTGYNHNFLGGYIWDFRIYPISLAAWQVTNLYQTDSIIGTPSTP